LRIYPCYIDKKKSRLQGRKISVKDAVEKPCAFYMAKAAELLGLSVVLESEKRHPRDPFSFGRLRVMQKNSLAGLKNKHQILVAISKKLEESVGLIPDEKGLIAAYAKFSLSELSPMPDPLPEAASQTAGPPVVSSSHNPNPPTVPASSSSSVKTKKKKEKRKILRM
jgi:signal recognition particle subunit SEC65